jgi:hypothetical protein
VIATEPSKAEAQETHGQDALPYGAADSGCGEGVVEADVDVPVEDSVDVEHVTGEGDEYNAGDAWSPAPEDEVVRAVEDSTHDSAHEGRMAPPVPLPSIAPMASMPPAPPSPSASSSGHASALASPRSDAPF